MDELGYNRWIMQTDGENAITAWAKETRKEWFRESTAADTADVERAIPLRTSPKESHASTGMVETTVQALAGLTRSLRNDVEKYTGIVITPSSPLLPWLVRHASFILTRFKLRANGRTAFEELRTVKYESPVVKIFEKVIAKVSGSADQKLEGPWLEGLWLGRAGDTNEHLVAAETGVVRGRTVR